MTGDDLDAIEPWLAGIMGSLKPAQQIRLSRKIGQLLRRRNAARIRQNVEPDGKKMEPRKPRRRGRGRRGKMFKKIGLAKNMRITARPDEVSIKFSPLVSGAASVHHFGLVDKVERTRTAPKIRYPARRLLGLPNGDREAIAETVMEFLDN